MALIWEKAPSRPAAMPTKFSERQRWLYHQMVSATATDATGRTK